MFSIIESGLDLGLFIETLEGNYGFLEFDFVVAGIHVLLNYFDVLWSN